MAMLTIDATCPHCLKENAVLRHVLELPLTRETYSVVFQCQSCLRLMVAEAQTHISSSPAGAASNSIYPINLNDRSLFSIRNIYPQVEEFTAPENTPERAAKFLKEAKEDFARGRYETSAMNCRKVIDIATKDLHLGNEDKLVRRISALRETGLITQEMADWAHIVRIDTNVAVHSDEEFSQSDVDQLLKFTEVFLIYSFTLPAMVHDKREEK